MIASKVQVVAVLSNLITLIVSFVFMYSEKSPLLDDTGVPRICEFTYTAKKSGSNILKIGDISECLALQVTDIFTQIFFIAGFSALLSGAVHKIINFSGESDDNQIAKHNSTFISYSVVASFLSVIGRGIFSKIMHGDEFTERMSRLEFDTQPFEIVFWINFTNIIFVSVLIILIVPWRSILKLKGFTSKSDDLDLDTNTLGKLEPVEPDGPENSTFEKSADFFGL